MYTRLTLPYTRGCRISGLLGVRNYINNYLAMYKRLTASKRIFCHVYASDALPYTSGIRTPRLLGVKSYLNNYFPIYKRLTGSRIRVELASPAYLGLGII